MVAIQLANGQWEYDPTVTLGAKGGFGQVFAGQGNGHNNVAVKRLHVTAHDAAHRELAIATELSELQAEHIIPVYDFGQDAQSDGYFIVMARAESSLQDKLDKNGSLSEQVAVPILVDIAKGLIEAQAFVHRDLKPGNVLYHEGKWKIADFGIARFVEEATSSQTLKDCLSAYYAAPEQWRYEHATYATDIYALGCIAYALLTGNPPFSGNNQAELQNHHLHSLPPQINGINPKLSSLLSMLLRKPQDARPDNQRVLTILTQITSDLAAPPSIPAFDALAQAGAAHAAAIAKAEATQQQMLTVQQQRNALMQNAFNILKQEVMDPLFQKVLEAVPTAQRTARNVIQIGSARLEYGSTEQHNALRQGVFPHSRWDVITQAKIAVHQGQPHEYIWSANLWYVKRPEDNNYRWWEYQYMTNAFSSRFRNYEPFAVDTLDEADKAAGPAMHILQIGAKPKLVDDENASDFHARWAELLAKASLGQLGRPHMLPLPG